MEFQSVPSYNVDQRNAPNTLFNP